MYVVSCLVPCSSEPQCALTPLYPFFHPFYSDIIHMIIPTLPHFFRVPVMGSWKKKLEISPLLLNVSVKLRPWQCSLLNFMDMIDGCICTLVRSAFGHYMWYKIALFPSSVPGTRLSTNMPQNCEPSAWLLYRKCVYIQGQRQLF